MKIASIAEVKAKLSSYVKASATGPVVVTRNGKAVAVLLGVDDDEELERLDEYEGVSEGLYRRMRTVTASGLEVWVYEYARDLPAGAKGPLDRWDIIRDTPGKPGG